MPVIDSASPTVSREYAGFTVAVPQPFAEGHTLTPSEAAFINAQLASVVGNQFGGMIRRNTEAAKAKGETFTLTDPQATFNAQFTEYKLGESNRGSGATATDPIAAEAHSIAVGVIKSALKAKGFKLFSAKTPNGVKAEKVNELATTYLAANPQVTELARQRVNALSTLSVDLGDATASVGETATESEAGTVHTAPAKSKAPAAA